MSLNGTKSHFVNFVSDEVLTEIRVSDENHEMRDEDISEESG
jgi:hypothetical protein